MTSRKTARPKAAAARASAVDAPPRYRLEFLESALREWQALDGSIKAVFRKQLEARLENPHFPDSELHGSLSGCYKIKLRAQGYRLVYQVRDEVLVVLVIAIDRRDKDKVYRAALKRIEALLDDPGSRPPVRKASRRGTA
jgi:mRNA interferase RelE/StbE